MPLLKLWYDLRARAIAILILLSAITIVQVAAFPSLKDLGESGREEVAKLPPVAKRFLNDYRYYAETRWLEEVDVLVIVAILLSVGGVLVESRTKTLFFTLSLPVSRRKWLLMQAALVFTILLAFALIASLPFFIGGLIFKEEFSVGHAINAALVLVLVTLPWIGITLFTSTYLSNDRLLPAIVVISLMILINIAGMLSPAVDSWLPKTLVTAVVHWSPGITKPLFAIFVSGTLSLFFAIRRFERMDF